MLTTIICCCMIYLFNVTAVFMLQIYNLMLIHFTVNVPNDTQNEMKLYVYMLIFPR